MSFMTPKSGSTIKVILSSSPLFKDDPELLHTQSQLGYDSTFEAITSYEYCTFGLASCQDFRYWHHR